MTTNTDWEKDFDDEFVKDNGRDIEPSFSDPSGQVGPVKAFIRQLLLTQLDQVEKEVIGEDGEVPFEREDNASYWADTYLPVMEENERKRQFRQKLSALRLEGKKEEK